MYLLNSAKKESIYGLNFSLSENRETKKAENLS